VFRCTRLGFIENLLFAVGIASQRLVHSRTCKYFRFRRRHVELPTVHVSLSASVQSSRPHQEPRCTRRNRLPRPVPVDLYYILFVVFGGQFTPPYLYPAKYYHTIMSANDNTPQNSVKMFANFLPFYFYRAHDRMNL
jgi:hypothetical protein